MVTALKEIKDLTARYGLSEQGLRKFIREHLSELNSDGQHVKRVGRTWKLDDVAIARLDKLRRYTEPKVEVVTLDETNAEIVKLREENSRLMKMLVDAQSEIIRLQRELLKPPETQPERNSRNSVSLKEWLSRLFKF